MSKVLYRWVWKTEDGSDRRFEINTFQGKEVARERAIATFQYDPFSVEYLKNNEPEQETIHNIPQHVRAPSSD